MKKQSDENSESCIPQGFQCPFIGDQSTRARATSPRNLRAGCHNQKDRLEHTAPDVIELWHLKQSFLMVSKVHQTSISFILYLCIL